VDGIPLTPRDPVDLRAPTVLNPSHPVLSALKFAARRLAKSPGFTVVSVVMLALGIGMSTSTFSITNSVLLSSMPFPEGDRLMRIFTTSTHSQTMEHAPGNFMDIWRSLASFSSIAAFVPSNSNVAEPGQPPELQYGMEVTANFLTTLGVQPFLGRGFAPDEDQPGKDSVVILTDSYWRRRFASDPKIVGKTLRIGTANCTVIGVLPPSFGVPLIWFGCGFLTNMTVWPPWATQRTGKWISLFGRLKPGVDLPTAQAELSTVAARLDHDHPAENGVDGLRATGLAASFVDANSRKLYWLVVGLAALVLVIACSNLASLQLARAFGRSHEFAVRAALGAGRLDLMGPLLLESLLLTLAGGVLGIGVAFWGNRLVSHYFTGNFDIRIDGRVALFASLASLITGLTFGLAPAWLASRVSTSDALKESSRGSTSGRVQRRLKFALIIGQLAMALVLVSSASSFSIAVKQFFKRDLGWQQAGLVSGVLNLPYEVYKEDAKKPVLVLEILEKLGAIPGVSRVSLASSVPIYGFQDQKKIIVEGAAPLPTGQEPSAFVIAVDNGFFTTLGIPLKEGRSVPATFKEGDPDVIVVNEALARQYWPGESAIGKRVKFTDSKDWHEVIGVAGNVSMATNFDTPPTRLQIYRPLQAQTGIWYNFILKSPLPPDTLIQPIRKTIGSINPDFIVEEVGGVPQMLENILAGNNLMIITLGSFALIGLLIAVIGLYGVVSQVTMQRSREIGVRMALGADYPAVVRLVLAQGCVLILVGVAFGLAGAFGVGAVYRQTMPGLRLPGAGLQAAIALTLCAVGLVACYFPARRAGRISPVAALRTE
jgi:putative ABC transport system permease protein